MNILTSKTEISDGRRFACFKVPQRTDSSTYNVHAHSHCLHHRNKTEEEKRKRTAHDPCVRVHPLAHPMIYYCVLHFRSSWIVAFLLSVCSANFSHSVASFFSTDNQLHLYAMFVYVFVSCPMSHRFVCSTQSLGFRFYAIVFTQ